MKSTSSISPEEPSELERFRQEWLTELRSRRNAAAISGTSTPARNDAGGVDSTHQSSSKTAAKALDVSAALSEAMDSSSQVMAGASNECTPSIYLATTPLPQKLNSAVDVYRRAVQREQSGDLDDALFLYRQAFRMDPHVDQIYHREEALASISAAQKNTLHKSTTSSANDSVEELTAKAQAALSVKSRAGASAVRVTSQVLAQVLAGFPDDLLFVPEIEEEPVHLQKLPEELLVMFLRKLDTTSIERFASVCRKARVIALDSLIWRELVRATYKPPQVTHEEQLTSVLERYLYDYRRVYIEHPRVRMDGVYIATCHYIRPGLSENSWVTINHLITYHRYLRFYPNGQVLSLLANEEFTPHQVIPLLKPTLRMKGFYIGTWSLRDATIEITNLLDASGRYPLLTDHPVTSSVHYSSGNEANRYTFVMTLDLISRPLGRWNKMSILAYNSVRLETGDVNPVALKNERPFWFSKVRSYSVY
ncbi:hypothetical protein C0992_002635 [Termitomyces sp. T32_za158]|nr:hypothetical protein C0992_002635 [Termitomyces sp. T32_za158]